MQGKLSRKWRLAFFLGYGLSVRGYGFDVYGLRFTELL